MNRLSPYAKAIAAFFAPGIVLMSTAVNDASPGGSTITGPEWVQIAGACIVTAVGVYTVPNRPARPPGNEPS